MVMTELLTIGEVAERTGLSAHTLRYYERVGLLDPVDRAGSGHRRYRASDLDWIAFLIRLRATEMPIRRMLVYAELRRQGDSTVLERRLLLEKHREELRTRVRELRRDLSALDEKINLYREMEERVEQHI